MCLRLLVTGVTFALTACGQVVGPVSQPTPDRPVQHEAIAAVAQRSLDESRTPGSILSDNVTDLGFKGQEEVAIATVGTPVEIFHVTPQNLTTYQPGQPVTQILRPIHQWNVPVVANGEGRTWILVGNENGRLEAHGIGGGPEVPGNVVRLQNDLADTASTIKLVEIPGMAIFALVEHNGQEAIVLVNAFTCTYALALCDKTILEPYRPEEMMLAIAESFAP